MQDSPGPALRLLVNSTTVVILGDTAVVLRVVVGDVGAATDAGVVTVSTNVPTHIVTLIVGTLHVGVAGDLTIRVGGVGGTVLGTLVVTRL